MGNCNSGLNCSTDASNEPLDADADIVGLGVLVAFFVTALAAVGAIVWGYFYDAFPEAYLSETDKNLISLYKASRFSTKAVPWLYKRWMAVKAPIMKLFSKDYITHNHEPLSQKKRSEALTKFILSLSDQQLVTGLAILIASLSNRCRVSIYEFRVVVSLAWFSSTTHQSTLRVLQHYFFANEVVRNWRIFGMVSLMIMLIFALIAQTGVAPQTTPLQCGLDNLQGAWNLSAVSNPVLGNEPSIFNMIIISIQLLVAYRYLLSDLFTETKGPGSSIGADIVKRVAWWRMKWKYRDVSEGVEIESKLAEAEAVWNEVESSQSLTPAKMMILRYQGSFLRQIPSMTFDMCFGISQVVSNRWIYAPKLGEASNRMDFGQIVPLFLLSLPMLVAAEIYYDSRSEAKEEVHSSAHSTSSTTSRPHRDSVVAAAGGETGDLPSSVPESSGHDQARISSDSTETSRPDAGRRVLKLVLYNFLLELVMSLLFGSTYNLSVGSTSAYIAIFYTLWSLLSPFISIYAFYSISKPDILHASLLTYRAKHSNQDPNQLPGSSPRTTTVPRPNPVTSILQTTSEEPHSQNQGIELQSLTNQDSHPQQHLHNNTGSSLMPSTPPSPVHPSDDGRLYAPSPQRLDTEASLGLHPPISDTQPVFTYPLTSIISAMVFDEPGNVVRNAGGGVSPPTTRPSANVDTSELGTDGIRKRETFEHPS